jgi:hypothetical protein
MISARQPNAQLVAEPEDGLDRSGGATAPHRQMRQRGKLLRDQSLDQPHVDRDLVRVHLRLSGRLFAMVL